MQSFDPSVTIALEAIAWCKHRRWHDGNVREQQFAVRMFRKAKADGEGWNDDDVVVETEPLGKLAEPKGNAKWKAWWREKELKRLA
jgi:hypothetical protein